MNSVRFGAARVVVAAFLALALAAPTAWAKSSSGGSHASSHSSSSSGLSKPSLSSSSSSSSSSSGLTKPSLAAPPGGSPTAAPSSGPAGLGKPSLTGATAPQGSTSAAPPRPAAGSGLDLAASKAVSKSALAKFDADQQKFSAPPAAPVDARTAAGNPVWASANGRYRTADDYYAARERGYANLHYQPPVVIYQSAPSFGMWDSMFLYLMLDRAAQNQRDYAMWAYSHGNDPGYQAWRRDAETRGDAETRAKLAALDAKVAELEAQKAPKDAAALPDEVDASVALAPQAVLTAQSRDKGMGVMGWVAIVALIGVVGFVGRKMFGRRV